MARSGRWHRWLGGGSVGRSRSVGTLFLWARLHAEFEAWFVMPRDHSIGPTGLDSSGNWRP